MQRGEADIGAEIDHPVAMRQDPIEVVDRAGFESAGELGRALDRDRVVDDVKWESARCAVRRRDEAVHVRAPSDDDRAKVITDGLTKA